MWEQVDRILRQATTQIADHIANFLPGLLVSLALILAACRGRRDPRPPAARASAARRSSSTAGPNQSGLAALVRMAGFDHESVTDGRARRLLDDPDPRACSSA